MALPSLSWQNIKALRKQHGWLRKGWRKQKSTPSSTWESNATELWQKPRLSSSNSSISPLVKGLTLFWAQIVREKVTNEPLQGIHTVSTGLWLRSNWRPTLFCNSDVIPGTVSHSSWGQSYCLKAWCLPTLRPTQGQDQLWAWQQFSLLYNTQHYHNALGVFRPSK